MKNLKTIALHTLILTAFSLITVLATATVAYSQPKPNVIKQGNTYVPIGQAEGKEDVLTGDFYKAKDGTMYPVYRSKKGKLYVIRVAKTSGKEYKYYLTEKEG